MNKKLSIPKSRIKNYTKTGRGFERLDMRKNSDIKKAKRCGLYLGDAKTKQYTKITRGTKRC